jgi:hypothetical protein
MQIMTDHDHRRFEYAERTWNDASACYSWSHVFRFNTKARQNIWSIKQSIKLYSLWTRSNNIPFSDTSRIWTGIGEDGDQLMWLFERSMRSALDSSEDITCQLGAWLCLGIMSRVHDRQLDISHCFSGIANNHITGVKIKLYSIVDNHASIHLT